MKLETKILDIIAGKKTAPVAKGLLNVLSRAYHAGIIIRHAAYDWVIPQQKLPLPVISVGNIVAGGTGKTPFVRYLAFEIGKRKKVAVLSRGYRRKGKSHLLVKEGMDPKECGDEPAWLAQKLPNANVIVGTDRGYTGWIAQILNSEVILLDDGMQYLALARDYEIALMHADDLFGKGFYLPRGLLRDSPKQLSKARLIVVGGVQDEEEYEKLKQELSRYSSAPITVMSLQIENGDAFASKKVAAFSAIAHPHRFYDTLKSLGCSLIETLEHPDHIPFELQEIEYLANRAFDQGAEILACTEKDAVKLPENLRLRLPIIPMEITLVPTFGKEHLAHLIEEVIQ